MTDKQNEAAGMSTTSPVCPRCMNFVVMCRCFDPTPPQWHPPAPLTEDDVRRIVREELDKRGMKA